MHAIKTKSRPPLNLDEPGWMSLRDFLDLRDITPPPLPMRAMAWVQRKTAETLTLSPPRRRQNAVSIFIHYP